MTRLHLSRRLLLAAAAFIWMTTSCGGDGGPAAPVAVASLSVSGASATPLLVGTTLQLTGLPRDASGNILADRTVTWTSSDTLVARVTASGLVTGWSAGTATITASSEKVTSPTALEFRFGGALGTDGGTITVLGGLVTVLIPPGALTQPSIVTVRSLAATGDARPVDGRMFELGPSGLTLSRSGMMTLRYDRAYLPSGLSEASLVLGSLENGVWSRIPGSTANTTSGTVSGAVTRSGTYGVLVAAVDHVALGGVPASGLIYAGQSVQLMATALDSAGSPLGARVATWTTSDASVLAVSTSGRVTAVQAGTATITATIDGKSASATLRVTLVPIASVSLSPGSIAIYAGGSIRLTAVARDSAGTIVTGRAVAWRSANDGVARVDSTGTVTGVAAGTVIVSATVGEQAGSISVQVLPAVVADWSGATEWGTFQGNASHTGFVNAVIDPARFHHAWTASPFPGVVLNPVTAGDGNVAVTSNAYFGRQGLAVLDAATGTMKWSYDFGAIHSVDPPAYAGGAVFLQTGGQAADSYVWSFEGNTGVVRSRAAYGNQWSRYYAPTVVDQSVYVAGGTYGGMYAYSTAGTQSWFLPLNQYDQFTPAVRDGVVYAFTGSYSPKLSAVSAATGAVLYEIPDPGFSWNGWSMDNALALGDANDALAIQGNRLISFDLAGRTIGWSVTGGFTGNVTVAGGVLYVIGNGQVEARRESDGQVLWLWVPPEGRVAGTTIVSGNLLFASTAAATYAVDLTAHRTVWSYPVGGLLALSGQGRLYIAQADGRLTAIAVE